MHEYGEESVKKDLELVVLLMKTIIVVLFLQIV